MYPLEGAALHGSWMPPLLARFDFDLPEFRCHCVASPRVITDAMAMVGDLVDSLFVEHSWLARQLPCADIDCLWRAGPADMYLALTLCLASLD